MNIMLKPWLRFFMIPTFVWTLSFIMPLYAQASSPDNIKVTVSGRNITLYAIVKQIELQSSIKFQMNIQSINLMDKVTCDWRNALLSNVMFSVFEERGYIWKYDGRIIYLRKPEVRGKPVNVVTNNDTVIQKLIVKVLDEKGMAVPSATIIVKESKQGAITDFEGNGTISHLPWGSTLLITSVGFQRTEIPVEGRNSITIYMKPSENSINEVTVVSNGYQDIPKERSTGSFEKIDTKLLNQQVGPNILDRLNGVTNGILFDKTHGNRDFMVRGLSTINGTTDPLIIVDNFPYSGNINSINPNDVSSITILKDAAATSIWGARAGNGVVVITTKKGDYNKKLKIEFNANAVVAGKPDLYAAPQMASSDFVDVQKMLFDNGFYARPEVTRTRPVLPPAVEILIAQRDGKVTVDQAESQLDVLRKHDVRSDFLKYAYQPSINQQYALNVSGGNEDANYYLSGGYDHDKSNLKSISDRISIRSQYGFKIKKGIDLKLNLNYTTSNVSNGESGYSLNAFAPYTILADKNGNPLAVPIKYRQPYIDTAGGGKLLDWHYYPLDDWKHNTTTNKNSDLVLSATLNYKIFKGLSATLSYQYEKQDGAIINLEDLQSFAARDLINTFTQIDPSGVITRAVPLGGVLQRENSYLIAQNARGQLGYNNSWNKHNVSAIIGGEISQANGEGDGFTLYGYRRDPLIYSSIDVLHPYPTYIPAYGPDYISSSVAGVNPYILTRFVSFYGNGAYTYNNKYTFTLSGRKDAANIFGAKTNDKWKPLWSTGLSWDLAAEPFYHLNFLPVLKPRITYGFSGNISTGNTAKTIIAYRTDASYTGLPYVSIQQFGNPSLRWESVGMLNIGVDFGLKNNRISGSLEYYNKKGTDLYGPAYVEGTAGLFSGTITKNAANMKADGVDIALNSQNIRGAFMWTTRFLFNFYTDKVTKYNNPLVFSSGYVGSGSQITPIQGKPLYSVTTYKWGGLDPQTGDPQGVLNGKPSKDYLALGNDTSLQTIDFNGTSLPKFYGTFSNSFSWKGFYIDVNIVYKAGYYFLKPSINYGALFSSGTGNADFAKRWQKVGDEKITNVPSMVYPNVSGRDLFYNYSSTLVQNGSLIRLQYINLGYDFLFEHRKSSQFSQLQVYVNASNLGLIWKANKSNIDPDFNNAIPAPRAIAVGLRASF